MRYQPIRNERPPDHYSCWTNLQRTGFRDAVEPTTEAEEIAALARWEAHRARSTRMRKCSACGSEKPLDADHFSRSSKPGEAGFQYNCKACSRALRQQWRRKNRERDNLGRKLLRAGLSIREGGEERMSKPIPGVIYQCKAATCAATVMWVKLPSGAYLLVNVQPDVERGAVRVTGTDGVVLPKLEAEAARISGEPLHRAHNETCINRQQFERARRNGGRELEGDRVSDLREAA